MTPRGIRGLEACGVLGMNRRNAEYIMKYNPRSAFPLVDNKLLTKELARKHGVPTPDLYHVMEHHGDVAGFEKALGDQREFALKPARGSGGSGIVLVFDRSGKGFVNQSGETIPREEISYHISGILSGIYSLEGLEDKAIVESLIHPHQVFAGITYQGVPDIRIIAYRGVPAMAMVRLPTKASDGKANLHRGAIGIGVDIATGRTLVGVHGSQRVTNHPDTGNLLEGTTVPHWDGMLLVAAKAFEMTGLGYIGVDLVLDRDKGPLLLEMNARPGLQIQVANMAGLLQRAIMIDSAPPEMLSEPEFRVAWAREAFAVLGS